MTPFIPNLGPQLLRFHNRSRFPISFPLWDIPFPFAFSPIFHEPVGTTGLAALVAQVPDCFLGQTSRSMAEKKKKKKKKRKYVVMGERIL